MPSLRVQRIFGPSFGHGAIKPFSKETLVPSGPRKAGQSLPLADWAKAGVGDAEQPMENTAIRKSERMAESIRIKGGEVISDRASPIRFCKSSRLAARAGRPQ